MLRKDADMFTIPIAADLIFVVLTTMVTLLVLHAARAVTRRLRGVEPADRPVASPALVLAIALVALLGVHVFRTGASVEAVDRGRAAAPGLPDSVHHEPVPGFVSARIGTVVGRSTLDLRQASVSPGQDAAVTVFVAGGRVTLRVPEEWEVDAAALPRSAVEDTRRPAHGEAAPGGSGSRPRLVLSGFVLLGTVEVTS
jgi:hypothetical protein